MNSASESGETFSTPLRGLNEYVYCPRLFHLMYVQELFEENVDTITGRIAHRKRLSRSKAVRSAGKREGTLEEGNEETPWPEGMVNEMTLYSEILGIHGKFDVILDEGTEQIPVEVKKGEAPSGDAPFFIGPASLKASAWPNDQIQLAGQIALLRETGHQCNVGRIYYRGSRKLVEIQWDPSLEMALRHVIDQTHGMAAAPMPGPLVDSKKCIRCSMNHVCLPDETSCLSGVLAEPRQLFPGRDDEGILHLLTPGTSAGKSGESMRIVVPDEPVTFVPIKDVAHVCCWGQVQLSTSLMLALTDRGINITWLTTGGWIRAITAKPLEKKVELRRRQYSVCDDTPQCLCITRNIILAKIENQRVFIRRNGSEANTAVLRALRACMRNALEATDADSLRGIEGYAAKRYWEMYPQLFQSKAAEGFQMKSRNRRPPHDPINAMLSYGYTMLLRDFISAIHGCGMDPMFGFFHATVAGRPALALDLMEAFRPLVVDSAVLRAVNEGTFTQEDFVITDQYCAMKPHAKKKWIKAYERRVDEMVTHPSFGYRLSYRRIFTLEARLFGRYLTGELTDYRPLTTR
mgnify:CR=1 FL=1